MAPPNPPVPPTPPGRHPGGRTCRTTLLTALLLTFDAMTHHWRDVPQLWQETGKHS